jgi:hypothetical protein
MSYDLMVFDPNVAPRERDAFLEWYQQSPFESETQIFNDPSVCSGNLHDWYMAIVKQFPDYNGDDFDDERIEQVGDLAAGYSIGPSAIYADFRWTVAGEAYDAVRRLAVEHKVGFYDVSGDEGDGEIYFPGDDLRAPSQGQWREISADFQAGDLSKYVSAPEAPKRRWFDFFRRK